MVGEEIIQGEKHNREKNKSTNVRLLLKHTIIYNCFQFVISEFSRVVFVCRRIVGSVASLYFGSHILSLSLSLLCLITLPFYPHGVVKK